MPARIGIVGWVVLHIGIEILTDRVCLTTLVAVSRQEGACLVVIVSCTEVVQTCHIPCFAIVGKWIACGICGLFGRSVEIVRARCNRIAILSQTCHRARLAGQIVIAVASALVSIGSSAIAIDIGLLFLELVVIGLQDLGVR